MLGLNKGFILGSISDNNNMLIAVFIVPLARDAQRGRREGGHGGGGRGSAVTVGKMNKETTSLIHLRTILLKCSSRPQSAQWPNHAT